MLLKKALDKYSLKILLTRSYSAAFTVKIQSHDITATGIGMLF